MSLIYGYSSKDDGEGSNNNNNNLKSLVGTKTDSKTTDTAFGRIHKNKEDILSSAASVVASTSKVVASVVSTVGQKTDAKTVDSTFGRIRKNKENIAIASSFVGSASSFEGESNLKGTQLSHASAITAHSNNLLELEDLLGRKTDGAADDTAFGRIKGNEENTVKRFNHTTITFSKFGDRETVKVFNSGVILLGIVTVSAKRISPVHSGLVYYKFYNASGTKKLEDIRSHDGNYFQILNKDMNDNTCISLKTPYIIPKDCSIMAEIAQHTRGLGGLGGEQSGRGKAAPTGSSRPTVVSLNVTVIYTEFPSINYN